jgi:3-methylcrotonyl-CoA carboxylase alpha subunit
MFTSILIANRGEIACRIIRTARAMGIRTVAVYSEADCRALHVDMADEAYCIGPAPAMKSYLMQENILRAAKESGAEAIHPGYGFLSENPEFAAACVGAGLVFIGPPAEVITDMGIKSRAKEIMVQAGIPVIPGCYVDPQNATQLLQEVDKIGYPLLIKADRGGGGKGIRLVHSEGELHDAIGAAGREAASAFGHGSLLLEKHITGARHIEVQIFRDSQGNSLHLYERDCSLQRRHQKILEEAPAAAISQKTRNELYDTAIQAANTIGYLGAGTVEFLVDEHGGYYFLEINTRLQVEHPVTEMITGQDLVQWQLLVAAGEPLPRRQHELSCMGHAIEVRIYAEDPARNFMPSSGVIEYLQLPVESENLRVDSGVREGDTVTPFYDPILAKLIVGGGDRQEAIQKLLEGLQKYKLAGLVTNIGFLGNLVSDDTFRAALHTSQYVDNNLEELAAVQQLSSKTLCCAALYYMLAQQQVLWAESGRTEDPFSPWCNNSGFRLNEPTQYEVLFHCSGIMYSVYVCSEKNGYRMARESEIIRAEDVAWQQGQICCRIDGRMEILEIVHYANNFTVFHGGRTILLTLPDISHESSGGHGADSSLRAPIPGNVTEVFVAEGDVVKKGDSLLVLEAMKMEYVIRAPADGRVTGILYQKGDSVQERDRLVDFEEQLEVTDAAS